MALPSINIVLITSVINPPNKPLSYSSSRSIYSAEERFIQTQKTIASIREKIPNNKIFILECSSLTPSQKEYLTDNSEYFINLYCQNIDCQNIVCQDLDCQDLDCQNTQDDIYGISKALGEGTMTIKALEYITNHIIPDITTKYNISIENINLFKISGRYWLTDNFYYNEFSAPSNVVFKQIENNPNNIFTALYKLPASMIDNLYKFLTDKNNISRMRQCIGYEVLFADFVKEISNLDKYIYIKFINPIGLSGYVTIDGSYYNG